MDGTDTGDIVEVDKDGFFFTRGRLKRFAKVSGEMVSLTAVEDALRGRFPSLWPEMPNRRRRPSG